MLKINVDKLTNIVIIGLCVSMVMCVMIFFKAYKNTSWNYYRDADSYIYYITEKRYSELPYLVYQSLHVDNPKEDLKECLALAEYYKNTSFYKMYEEVGETAKAEEYLAKMDENKKDVGDLSFTIVDINEELGVEFQN